MYKEKLCPFVWQVDFDCFCVKEYKNEDEQNEDSNNDTNTASSNNETPPLLQKNQTHKQQGNLRVIMRQIVTKFILKKVKNILIYYIKTTFNHSIHIEMRLRMLLNHLYIRWCMLKKRYYTYVKTNE
jgi:hypothetical protein